MARPILPLSLCLLVLSACAPGSTAKKAEPSVAPGANDRYATEQGRAVTLQSPRSGAAGRGATCGVGPPGPAATATASAAIS